MNHTTRKMQEKQVEACGIKPRKKFWKMRVLIRIKNISENLILF